MHGRDIGYLAFFLAGGALGTALGMLIAPASGLETRRRLGRRLDEERDEILRRGRRAVEDVAGKIEGRVEEGKQKLVSALGSR